MEIKITSEFGENRFDVTTGNARKIISLAMELHRDEGTPEEKEQKPIGAGMKSPDPELAKVEKTTRTEKLFETDWKKSIPEPRKSVATGKNQEQEPEYVKGFIIPKCEKCGKVGFFFSKERSSSYECSCGHVTAFHEMKPVYMDCRCGEHFRYMTNLQTASFKYKCINCGEETELSMNSRRNAYITVGGGSAIDPESIARINTAECYVRIIAEVENDIIWR